MIIDTKFKQYVKENAGEWGTPELTNNYKAATPGQIPEKRKIRRKKKLPEAAPGTGIGPEFGTVRSSSGIGMGYSIPLSEEFLPENPAINQWAMSENTHISFTRRYGDRAAEKIIQTAFMLEDCGCGGKVPARKKRLDEFRDEIDTSPVIGGADKKEPVMTQINTYECAVPKEFQQAVRRRVKKNK